MRSITVKKMKSDHLNEFKRKAKKKILQDKNKIVGVSPTHLASQSTNTSNSGAYNDRPTEKSVRVGFCDYLE